MSYFLPFKNSWQLFLLGEGEMVATKSLTKMVPEIQISLFSKEP